MRKFILPATLLALAAATPAAAQVKRIGAPSSPILQAAVVPAGTDIMYVSGITPPALNAGMEERRGCHGSLGLPRRPR